MTGPYDCGDTNVGWTVEAVSGGRIKLETLDRLCLDVLPSLANEVALTPWSPAKSQDWRLEPIAEGTFVQVVNAWNDQALTVDPESGSVLLQPRKGYL